MKRSLLRLVVSTPMALVLLGLVAVQPALAGKRSGTPDASGNMYWCVGQGTSRWVASNPGTAIPTTTPAWNGDDFAWMGYPSTSITSTAPDYHVQINYWNSVMSQYADPANGNASSLGYSSGVYCIQYPGTTAVPDLTSRAFKVVIPGDPPVAMTNQADANGVTNNWTNATGMINLGAQTLTVPSGTISVANDWIHNATGTYTFDPSDDEKTWAEANPDVYPGYGDWPFKYLAPDVQTTYPGASVAGGPVAYPSIWQGCSWADSNSCTNGSSLPWWGATHSDANGQPVEDPASTGTNNRTDVFPRQLKHVTSIPSTWTIGYPSSVLRSDPDQTWDASFDIWFDKTGTPNSGHAGANIYSNGTIRGQNDGLEIMVWVDHNHSYVDSPAGTDPVAEPPGRPNVAGYAQPSGWPREIALIGGVYYEVWTSRLNNAYYGYASNQQIAAGGHLWDCPTLAVNGGSGDVCGAEWNVVSFVAMKDYRKQSMSLDAKVFTDYILGKNQGCTTTDGVEQCMWKIIEQKEAANRDGSGVLQCPVSSTNNQGAHPMTSPAPCLLENWVLTSVMAGFETWIGGNGLETTGFKTGAWVANAAIQGGRVNDSGQPVVFWGAPFEVAYAGCPVGSGASVSFYVDLPDSTSWPTGGAASPQDMGAQQADGLFVYTVPALYPMHGPATVHFISSCGNSDLSMFIDPSGQVFYSDGVTPAPGAMATLLDAISGDAIPDHNEGLLSPVMQPDDNTMNGMPTDQWGSYAWNVVPGDYQVRAELRGCGSVTSPVQHVVSEPIMGLNLTLPCTAPTPPAGSPLPPTGNLSVTLSIFNNWTTGGPNGTGGYCATVNGTNSAGAALDWTAAFTLPEPGAIYDFWNATYTQSGDSVTAAGIAWNNILEPGATLRDVGFCVNRGTGSAPTTHTLNVGIGGSGSGTVTSSPAGINCGSDCTEDYAAGTTVTLTATPASGSTLAGWNGACSGPGVCTVTMNAAESVSATFDTIIYSLSVSKAGSGSGTVTSSPAGINCGGDCSENYAAGTVVTLTATPASGSTFAGWSGACSGTGTCTVTMNANQSVTARFNAPPATTRLRITTDWGTGYCADVLATNNTSQPLDWRVTFPIPGGTISNFWNAIWSQSGSQVTAEGLAWNNILQPGQTTQSVGFCANR